MKNRKVVLAIALIAIACLVTYAIATVLFTLTIPSTWQVTVSQGLELDYSNGTIVSSLPWSVSALGSQSQNLILKNKANHAVNVTAIIPASTGVYSFTSTFVNNTIAQGSSYAFSVTLTDLGMDSAQVYNGNFAFEIVDHFSLGNDNFGATSINYASDTSQYFSFVSDSFNSSSYGQSDTVLYSFTTKNINQTYEIQGLSYKLEVLDSGNNVVSTVCDGLVVAYYQDASHYGTFGNGTHMTDSPLMPNQTMTIWNSFPAPSTSGTYHLRLTYESHNSAPVVQPIILTWLTPNTSFIRPQTGGEIDVNSVTVTNGANPNTTATVGFNFVMNSDDYISQLTHISVKVVITDVNGTVISTPYSSIMISGTFNIPFNVPETLSFTTPNPTVSTQYTITVTIIGSG